MLPKLCLDCHPCTVFWCFIIVSGMEECPYALFQLVLCVPMGHFLRIKIWASKFWDKMKISQRRTIYNFSLMAGGIFPSAWKWIQYIDRYSLISEKSRNTVTEDDFCLVPVFDCRFYFHSSLYFQLKICNIKKAFNGRFHFPIAWGRWGSSYRLF